jgi:hypothetical protein
MSSNFSYAGAAAITATCALIFTLWSKGRVMNGAGSKLLHDFRLKRVLKASNNELSLLGTFATDAKQQSVLVLIQKTPLDPRSLEQLLQSLSLHTILQNDIYSSYMGDVSRKIKPFKVGGSEIAPEGRRDSVTTRRSM